MSSNFIPTQTGLSRVFVAEGGASAENSPEFKGCVVLGSISQDLGDVEQILCPDPDKYGNFEEIGETVSPADRVESSLTGRFPLDSRFDLITWASRRCELAVHAHFGECSNPKSFNDSKKAIIFEKSRLTSIDIDDVGSLEENSVVNGSADFSAASDKWYEVVPLTYSERAQDLVTNEVVDVTVWGSEQCDDCGNQLKLFAATLAAGGSPSTPADVLFSLDKGVNWFAHDVDSLASPNNPSGIDVVGDNVVVISNDTASLHYALNSEHDGVQDPTYAEVSTGFVAAGAPNAIWSTGFKAFIVGDNGYIYETDDAAAGVTVLDAGSTTTDNLNDVHAVDDALVVICGNNGAVLFSLDGSAFSEVSARPVGAGIHLNAIWAKDEKEWWVGTSNGRLYYTINQGDTWTERAFNGSGAGQVRDITFPTPSVGFISHDTAAPRGRILKTIGGGAPDTWYVVPRNSTITDNDRLNAIATVSGEPNLIVGGGLGADGSDGFIIVGKD